MCWILSAAGGELLSCQTVGPTEGQLYRMERLSRALVGYGSDYVVLCTFPNKKKPQKVILNSH